MWCEHANRQRGFGMYHPESPALNYLWFEKTLSPVDRQNHWIVGRLLWLLAVRQNHSQQKMLKKKINLKLCDQSP